MVHPLVERATSGMLVGPDWAMNIEICDILNHDPGQSKDVVRGIKRRLRRKNPKTQLLALTLLETLIKNCGDIVHMHVAERDVLHQMVKIVKKKPDLHVREKILTLLDTWQEAFGGPRARYPQYYAAYQELLRAGAIFPARSERAVDPNFTPQAQNVHSSNPDDQGDTPASSMGSGLPNFSLTEIQSARCIMDVLSEMLSTLEPGDKEGLNQEAILDLVDQCHSYKKRVVHLLNNTSDEELLCQGLTLNDDLEKLLSKYDAIALGITVPPEKNKPLAALLDIGDGSDASQANDVEHGFLGQRSSVPNNIENQPPLQQLLLCAPPGALSTPSASLNSKMDLLSFEDLQPPTGNDTLALVPVGNPTSQSSQTQQLQDHDALALSDPFPQDCLSDMMLPTAQQSSQSETKAQSQPEGQQIMWSLGSNGSIPDLGEPQQLQLVQNDPYPNVPSTGLSEHMLAALHASDSTTAMGAHNHLQQQMVPAFYSNGSFSTMEAAHQHQQMQTALYSNGSILNAASGLHDQTAYFRGMHLNQTSPDFNGQVTSKLNNPQLGVFMRSVEPNQGSSSTGAFPPAPWEIQPMETFQAFEFGHGQQAQMQFPEHMPYRLTTPEGQAQRAEGFTLQNDIYRNSYQTSATYSQPKKLVKPQDTLFGDLVSIAKVKSKPTSSEK